MIWLVMCLLGFQDSGQQSEQRVQEELTVTYKTIRLHVADKNGNPVKGLTADDLEVLYNGQIPEDLKVTEVDGVVAAADEVTQYAVIFIDTGQMNKGRFEDAMASARQIIEDLTPYTHLSIAHLDGGFERISQFSTNADYLKERLETIEHRGNLTTDASRSWRAAWDSVDFLNDARALVADGDNDTDKRFKTLEIHMKRSFQNDARVKMDYYKFYFDQMRSLTNMLAWVDGDKSIFMLSGGQFSPEHTQKYLSRLMNGSEITMYTLFFDNPKTYRFQNTSPRGLSPNTPKFARQNDNAVQERAMITRGLMDSARATGGFAEKASRSKNIRKKMEQLLQRQNHYYRVAFPILTGPTGALEIAVPDQPKLELTYGREILERIPYSKLPPKDQRIAERAMLFDGKGIRNDLDISFKPVVSMEPDGSCHIAMVGCFGENREELQRINIMFAAVDNNGIILDETYAQLANIGPSGAEGFYEILMTGKRPDAILGLVSDPRAGAHTIFRFPGDQTLAQQIPGRLAPLHIMRAQQIKMEAFQVADDEWNKLTADLGDTERMEADRWLSQMQKHAARAHQRIRVDPLRTSKARVKEK